MEKIKVSQAVIVEGKYDKIRLESLLDAFILPVGGFGVFSDPALRRFLQKLAGDRGLLLLTDSDAAGFKIRGYLAGLVPPDQILHAYIPDIYGKEARKQAPSKEGKLGVEGMSTEVLRQALQQAGVSPLPFAPPTDPITRLDLYNDGFWGRADSKRRRALLYRKLDFPARLNATGCLALLNGMLTRGQYAALAADIAHELTATRA
jgi:Small primase-like proteins (Toprim domain)